MMDYYLGLDMGTSSVGWACTNENYELVRAKGKDLWGVRLFEEAETAAGRRGFRVSRRRRAREKAKIGSLKAIFAEAINAVDPGFFERLEDSKLFQEDKRDHQPFALFADQNYTDRDFFAEYPTIFHLRKALIVSDQVFDVRLVFLSILNLFKHRGHFLNANLDADGEMDFAVLYSELKEKLSVLDQEIDLLTDALKEALEKYLPSKNLSRSKKAEMIAEQAGINKRTDKAIFEMTKMCCGLKGKITAVFSDVVFEKEKEGLSLSFTDGNLDDSLNAAEEILTSEMMDLLFALKAIHDWGAVAAVMGGEQYLSFARVRAYEKHQKDLTVLKKLLKDNSAAAYNQMFRIMKKGNYSAYIGSTNAHGQQIRRTGKEFETSREDFYKYIDKVIKNFPDSEEKTYVLDEIANESFLLKQLTAANGVIPNQIHQAELKQILANAAGYLPFLNEKNDSGLTAAERILALFEFQIPYYVGPLKNDGSGHAWSVRKESGTVYPWNFEEKIDLKASAEKFIENLVRHCTYLNDECVLPKSSLLYEKFRVLNELNNLKINGFPISVELKQKIYRELFKKGNRVTGKKLYQYLQVNGDLSGANDVLTGFDGDFKNTLSTYAHFSKIFNTETLTDKQFEMAEQIVFWSTVYGDSKKFLKEKIEAHYGDVLTKDQLKKILSLKFKDWGKLSGALLTLDGYDLENGEHLTIIDRMWQQNVNLMELLSKKYTYLEEIEKRIHAADTSLQTIQPEDLDDLYCSAPVKRMIWQTIRIVRELVQVLGAPPKRIFIEMAREEGEKGDRKESRKTKLMALYKKCREEAIDYDLLNQTEESKFRSKKLYLYYLQQGRCMYSGEVIRLSDLFNDNLYDIDHIYPRHFVKDDSIENNLVLVKKQNNAEKTDTYPIAAEIRNRQQGWWRVLKEKGFITEEKYKRLVRSTAFTLEEQAGFISRQLVETRQGTKAVAEIFKEIFDTDQTEIVYVKAGNTSAFRQHFDIVKCREVNDFHHAHDAYLNIVTGNTYLVKFTKDPLNFVKAYRKDAVKNPYHMYKIFDFDVRRGDETAWIAKDDISIRTVKKMIAKQTPLVTRMSKEVHGGLTKKQTIYSAKKIKNAKGKGYLPVKTTELHANAMKYGGFKDITGTYFFLVEHLKNNKHIRTIEMTPLYLKNQLDTTEKLQQYCERILGYIEPDIRLSKIKMTATIKVNGYFLYLTGRSNDRLIVRNAVELKLDTDWQHYIKKLIKVKDDDFSKKKYDLLKITKEKNLECFDLFSEKLSNEIFSRRPAVIGNKLVNKRDLFIELSINDQIQVLISILSFFSNLNNGVDLTKIGEGKTAGEMKINKKISDNEEFILIQQSPSGLFQSEIDLLTI